MRSILVFRGGALGDFIVTLPALALLRARWPDARIELVGNATAAQLALNRRLLTRAHSQHEARWSTLYGDAPLPDAFAAWLADFDLVVNYWPDPDGELRRRFPSRKGQTFLHADAMPTRALAAAHYCEPLRALALEPKEFLYRLEPVATSVSEWSACGPPAGARSHEGKSIAVHPGSGSPKKNWPRENWLTLIDRLPPPVTIILGEAEAEAWRATPSHSRHVLLNRPLEELVSHLSACRLFIGHDSGISHLAAACGAPCVLLFGATAPKVWAPPAARVRWLQHEAGLASVAVADVQNAVAAMLADRT